MSLHWKKKGNTGKAYCVTPGLKVRWYSSRCFIFQPWAETYLWGWQSSCCLRLRHKGVHTWNERMASGGKRKNQQSIWSVHPWVMSQTTHPVESSPLVAVYFEGFSHWIIWYALELQKKPRSLKIVGTILMKGFLTTHNFKAKVLWTVMVFCWISL